MKGKLKKLTNIIHNHYEITLAVIAVLLVLTIETLGRFSLIGSIKFMVTSPLVFFCNAIIVLAVISLSLFFRRRVLATCLLSIIWLALGITNGVILSNRMTPFNVKDMGNLEEGKQIITNYISAPMLIVVGIVILLIIVGVIIFYRKGPKLQEKVNHKKVAAIVLAIMLAAFGSVQGAMKVGILDTFFANLAYAYRDNGVVYSFLITWVKTGIDKPSDYSEEEIKDLFKHGEMGKDKIYTPGKDSDTTAEHKPNIIFLQLESFMDPTLLNDIELSQDPIPNFRQLRKDYSSGALTVPAVGAGTANVEFEVMTQISARFFGPGEYPYKSVLTEKTCESMPYDMRELGYSSHAIHNHRGAFYNRNIVFRNMGFDTFTCLEYMNNVIKTPKNWAKDALLTECMLDALKSTEGPDYIYTISVQGHGKYPTEKVLDDPVIEVTSAPTEEKKWAYEYYVNQIYEMDLFVKELTEALEDYDEDVILVMYGDHLPALDITEDEIETGDLYQTQYVAWSNFDFEKEDKDICAYEISADILKRLGISNGMLTKYHQNYGDKKGYKKGLKALSYDMLYGKQYIYGEQNPYEPTDMQMGVKKIKIDEVVQIGNKYYIKGQNFTEYSKISLDGKILKTVYLGPTILALNEEVDPEDASKMKVSQVEKNEEILSTTE